MSAYIQHTIATAHLRQLVGASNSSLNEHLVLRRSGIHPAIWHAAHSRVDAQQFARAIGVLVHLTRDEFWGLCSTRLPTGTFAHTVRVMRSASHLGEALALGLRQYRLVQSDFVPQLRIRDGVATVRLLARRPVDIGLAHALRTFAFFSYGVASWLVAQRLPLLEVTYPAAQAAEFPDAGTVFKAPAQFSPFGGGWSLDASSLQLPIVRDIPDLASFLAHAPLGLLHRYRHPSSLRERLYQLLRTHSATELPTFAEVSRSMAMTPQTLRRHLKLEGLSFRQLKADMRRDVAIKLLLRGERSLPEIAHKTGFSESSTFQRAFKAWTGLAPGIYRARNRH